ncbi:NAD-dependent epimerase/dehydratase family protein [Allostreptomyces psammosilenae]|uniref:Dihydroflavonol-4-reductase n=1 Tax=Allostreptomyces psammosilenae TaxID=1892865 RepID=A0A852ZXB4_9ACTN|nr:NAD-dependent epimerase/dehydratase family protein [Allostreptomyces psammosilenae]NYI05364.1 dihydroflavonol-4-reductase [Allostreptomyces psammosilenae]
MSPSTPAQTPVAPSSSLVTGATGLLGSNIVRALLERGAERVTAVVRDPARARDLLPDDPRLKLVAGDVNDIDGFRDELSDLDAVFHCAAYFREYYQPAADTALLMRTNVDAVEKLLHASAKAGVRVLVHTSSTGALSTTAGTGPLDEDTPNVRPGHENAYQDSKARSEEVIARFLQTEDRLRVPIVNPAWMWGPGDAAPTSAGRLFLAIAGGTMRALPSAGNHAVDARDVADGCLRAAEVGVSGRRYVFGGRFVTMEELATAIDAATGCGVPRVLPARVVLAAAGLMEFRGRITNTTPVATRAGVRTLIEGTKRRVSSARVERELGITFRPFKETITDLADWYREHGFLNGGAGTAAR